MKIGTYKLHFNSILDLLKQCNLTINKSTGVHEHKKGGVTRSFFIGRCFSSWKDVMDKANSPWSEGIDLVNKMLDRVKKDLHQLPSSKNIKRIKRHSEQLGDELDIDKLRSGQTDYWVTTERKLVLSPQHINILSNFGILAYVSPEEALWRGVTSILLCDILENAGFRVEIQGFKYAVATYKNGDNSFFSLTIKEPNSPIDIVSLINSLSGWFYRTVIFQANYIRKDVTPQNNLGSSIVLQEESTQIKEMSTYNIKTILVDNIWSAQECLEKVKKIIKELNND